MINSSNFKNAEQFNHSSDHTTAIPEQPPSQSPEVATAPAQELIDFFIFDEERKPLNDQNWQKNSTSTAQPTKIPKKLNQQLADIQTKIEAIKRQVHSTPPAQTPEGSPSQPQPLINPFIFYDDNGKVISSEERLRLDALKRQANSTPPAQTPEVAPAPSSSLIPSSIQEPELHELSDSVSSMPDCEKPSVRDARIVYQQDFDDYQLQPNAAPQRGLQLCQNKRGSSQLPLSSFEIARKLLQKETFLVYQDQLYHYNRIFYKLCSQNDFGRLLMASHCQNDVEAHRNTSVIPDVCKCLLYDPKLKVSDLKPPKDKICFLNCILDLNTGTVEHHSPLHHFTSAIQVNYSPNRTSCPIFENFLHSITNSDPLLMNRIWEMIGYCLTSDMDGKCFFLLQGVGNSGKSTLGRILLKFFDPSVITALDINALGAKFGPSNLVGKRINAALDISLKQLDSSAVGNLKALTGGDILSSDVKFSNWTIIDCYCKFIYAINGPLTTKCSEDESSALLCRMVVIPFAYSIPPGEQNHHLEEQIQAELSAIAAKAIGYYWQLRNNNYQFSGDFHINEVVDVKLLCENSISVSLEQCISNFLKECCVFRSDIKTHTFDLHNAFNAGSYCPYSVDTSTFSATLSNVLQQEYPNFTQKSRWRGGFKNPQWGFVGLGLKESPCNFPNFE